MKTKRIFLSAVLTALLTLPMFAQYGTTDDSSHSGSGRKGTGMMGKPVYESTVQGTHIRVWVMADNEYNKMKDSKEWRDSSGMNNRGTGMDRMGTDNRTGSDRMGTGTDRTGTGTGTGTMGTGTGTMGTNRGSKSGSTTGTASYHLMVEATEGSSGRALSTMSGTVQVTSPSMKTTSVDLQPMANHYGADVNLDEKGQYQFTLNLTVDGTSKTAQFEYTPGSSSNNR